MPPLTSDVLGLTCCPRSHRQLKTQLPVTQDCNLVQVHSFAINLKIFLSVLHKIINCGYSLETPCKVASNEYPYFMFLWRHKQDYLFGIAKCPHELVNT